MLVLEGRSKSIRNWMINKIHLHTGVGLPCNEKETKRSKQRGVGIPVSYYI
jgi:hypothetical protein